MILPRLDLKPLPCMKTVNWPTLRPIITVASAKYQWVAVPLELHGVAALKNGETVEVRIGCGKDEPRLVIEDLLPHLGAEQSKKPLGEAIPAETLNILVGSQPLQEKKRMQ